jgi:hypothetical protein
LSTSTFLFSKHDLRGTLEQHAQKARSLVLSKSIEQIAGEAGDALIVELEREYRVKPLRLLEERLEAEKEETKVDVSQDPLRNVLDRRRPFYIPGQRVRYIIPYEGDPVIWNCRPSTFSSYVPRAKIEGSELVFEFEVPHDKVSATKHSFKEELSSVKQSIQYADADVEIHNQRLAGLLKDTLALRRKQLEQVAEQFQDLGIPIRKRPSVAQAESQPVREPATRSRSPRSIKAYEYDVALSFAGEDRHYVEQVAKELQASGIKVFYDQFEKVQLWGRNLADHLGEIYGKRSRFVVMFVSKHYPHKGWPTHERQSAQARAIRENKIVLLPARFDDTEIPGLPASTAYVDLRRVTPRQLAEMIQQKLAE